MILDIVITVVMVSIGLVFCYMAYRATQKLK